MNGELKVREYRVDDKKKLINILKLNVPRYFAENEVEDFTHYIDNELEEYFVVVLDNEIIGAGGINFENNYKTGIISWDFINPNFQKRGIGRKLLTHRIELLKAKASIENIIVRTSQHTYKFYEKSGFVLNEVKKDFWADGFDLYKMSFNNAF